LEWNRRAFSNLKHVALFAFGAGKRRLTKLSFDKGLLIQAIMTFDEWLRRLAESAASNPLHEISERGSGNQRRSDRVTAMMDAAESLHSPGSLRGSGWLRVTPPTAPVP
jgi:hypothetical protein